MWQTREPPVLASRLRVRWEGNCLVTGWAWSPKWVLGQEVWESPQGQEGWGSGMDTFPGPVHGQEKDGKRSNITQKKPKLNPLGPKVIENYHKVSLSMFMSFSTKRTIHYFLVSSYLKYNLAFSSGLKKNYIRYMKSIQVSEKLKYILMTVSFHFSFMILR